MTLIQISEPFQVGAAAFGVLKLPYRDFAIMIDCGG